MYSSLKNQRLIEVQSVIGIGGKKKINRLGVKNKQKSKELSRVSQWWKESEYLTATVFLKSYDACSSAGGGRVVFPSGRYLTVKSTVTLLHLRHT
ncbi:hypothetical protein L1987_24493 [Smallanthus sonchifolius]|uniref:Uncharacterized protein n=1 Tax=Smallanthus sonchifolius TaxID=185202 RepID=A0ACB9IM25_9ASTR|nr:hypothetical protein L1987_24493 [Smallanthus sonchifolius]